MRPSLYYQALDRKTFISNKPTPTEKRPYNGRNGYVYEYVTVVTAYISVYTAVTAVTAVTCSCT
jgi:hypothetical protein